MYPLTANVSTLIALTATAVVLGLVAVFAIQFITRVARDFLESL